LLRSERRRTPLRTYAFMGALQAVTLASSVRRSCHVWPTTATCGQPLIFQSDALCFPPLLRPSACAT
jgi:hypothetical protein